ncbi:hypothetical protein [Kocuria oceani]|uniref:PilZ domain-containing protein n=1 Tax=Kocuria oceani TaxID=988827 RepID=A0ABV9TLR4_9MICC|nr:hypothetical protein [Kocuria oceani]
MSVADPEFVPSGTEPVRISPGIGVGVSVEPTPAVDVSGLSRCRVLADRPGLGLRAGELVLCAPYEPAELGMVVLVRCEADGHSPGALLSAGEVEVLEPALELVAPRTWHRPGHRA